MTFLPYYSTETAIFRGHDTFCPMRFSASFRSSGFVYKLIHHHIHFSVQDDIHFYPSVSRILSSFCPRQRTLKTIIRFRRIRTGLWAKKTGFPPLSDGTMFQIGCPRLLLFTKKDAFRRPDRFQRFYAQGILCSFVFFRYTEAFAAAAFRASTLSSFSQGRSRSFLPKCP